jgi:hypothetical protein
MAAQAIFRKSVFINCPFDHDFQPLFRATIFTVHYAGFLARSALEVNDSSQTRLLTIFQLVAACRYGIHDLSRTELDRTSGLPRFNMPLEPGLRVFLLILKITDSEDSKRNEIIAHKDLTSFPSFASLIFRPLPCNVPYSVLTPNSTTSPIFPYFAPSPDCKAATSQS